MSAPGWYSDPDGSPRLRYFDGRQWTAETADQPPVTQWGGPPMQSAPPAPGYQQQAPQSPQENRQSAFEYQGQQAGFPPNMGHPGSVPSPTPRNHLWAWMALAVVVVLIIALGTWLVFFRGTPTTTPVPRPSITLPADPTTVDPAPTDDPTEDPTTSVPDPSPTVSPSATLPVEPGGIIEPLENCPATATDAMGTQGADGRYTSGAGLSMPAAEGFTAGRVQYPWVHQSNAQIKQYGASWMASVTVGTVLEEDGFTETGATAVAMVACLLGSDFYANAEPVGTVGTIERAPDQDVVAMSVDVAVQGQPDITGDLVYVMVINANNVMHVVVATVPVEDPEGTAAVGDVVRNLSLS